MLKIWKYNPQHYTCDVFALFLPLVPQFVNADVRYSAFNGVTAIISSKTAINESSHDRHIMP
jgi:hypothetical protein